MTQIINVDPTEYYTKDSPDYLMDCCGLIPWWFNDADETLSAEEIIDRNYIIPFSSHLMEGFEVTEDHVLKYPGDPNLYPYVQFNHNDSSIRIYPYGITSITTDDDTKIARLD